MIVLRCPASRLPKVLILLLTWVVVAGLSWADLVGAQIEPAGALVDAQVATEPDLDELRDDGAPISLTAEELPARLSLQARSSCHIGVLSPGEIPLPTRLLLSKLSVYRL
ncbi:MAG: hypothetical protein ABS70_05515 [Nitrospira sp. SCN 59-13]|nr:MAG: hypothetical protein ABS70_05515 [Nitrospira sp. SCN 59-13]